MNLQLEHLLFLFLAVLLRWKFVLVEVEVIIELAGSHVQYGYLAISLSRNDITTRKAEGEIDDGFV